MKSLQLLVRLFAVAVIAVSLALAAPAKADPSGRVATTSVWVDTSHWETRVIGHSDPFWINAYEPPGTGPHDHSGNHQAFCPSPGSLSPGEDPSRCHGNYHEGGDITETVWVSSGYWSTTTVALPPATVSGSVNCTYGANGWCVSPATLTITGSEPVAGYSISSIQGSRSGAPFTCSGAACAQTVADTTGESFTYQAFSTFGDSSFASNTAVKVDTLAPVTTPVIAGTNGLNGWFTSPSVTFQPTASDATSGVASVEASVDSGSWADAIGGVIVGGEGTHTIRYRSRDAAGNEETAQSLSAPIDSIAPTSRFTSHTSGQYVTGVVNLSGATTDATSGVASIAFSVGGANWTPLIGATSWSQTWDTTTLPDGAYSLYARGADAAGNQEHTASLTLNVDNSPPVVSIELGCPLPGDNGWCRAPVTVSLNASDAGSGLASTTYTYRGAAQTVGRGSASFVDGDGGARDVSLCAVDALGHRSPTQSATVKIDGAPPTVRLNGGDRAALNVEVSDSESGVERWTLQVFGADGQSVFWQELGGAFSGALAWNAATLPGGMHVAQMFASDEAGNESGAQFALTLPALPLPTPTPVSIVEQVFTFFTLPTPTTAVAATATPSPTPMPMPTPMPTPAPVAVSALPPSPPPEQPMKRVNGLVFRDLNANGRRDTGEPGLAGIVIEIVTVGENVKRVIATGGDGAYSATLLPGKRYLLRVVPPQGVLLTTPAMAFVFEGDAGGNVVFGVNWSVLPVLMGGILLLMLFVWIVSAALDRRPGAVRALASEVEIVATFRLRQRVFELRQNDLQL